MAATAKGGTVLVARTAVDIGWMCGLCVGLGHRPDSQWPPAIEYLPDYRSDVLQAYANMQNWPEYANQHGGKVRCVVVTRDPWKRFKSLYLYSYQGSEYGLLQLSQELQSVHNKSIAEGVDFLYRCIGEYTIRDSLKYLNISLSHPGCIQIKFEDFEKDFNGTMGRWFDQWAITRPEAREYLLAMAAKHDLKQKSNEVLSKEHHTTKGVLSKADEKAVVTAMRNHAEIRQLLNEHAKFLGYDTQE